MPKQQLVLNDFSGGLNTYQDPRDLQMNELQTCQNFTFQRRNSLASIGSFATHADAGSSQAGTISGGYGLFSFESDFSPVAYEAVDTSQSTNIIFGEGADDDTAVAAGTGTIVGGLNGNDDDIIICSSHTNSGLKDANITSLKPGDTILVSGTAKNNGLYTISFIGDSVTVALDGLDNSYTNSANVIGVIDHNHPTLDAESVAANSTTNGSVSIKTHALGENLLVLSDVNNGNLDVYKKSNDAFENGAINAFGIGGAETGATPEFAFYAIDNQLRVSDGRKKSAAFEVSWYGYIERHHFRGVSYNNVNISSNGKGLYKGFYEASNSLSPPHNARTNTSDTYPTAPQTPSVESPYRNGGFTIKYTNSSANAASNWQTETWKIAVSFVYDGNQESLLYIPTSSNTFVTTAGNELTLRVMAAISASLSYSARVSGGRIYYKPADTEGEPWTLLCNIDLQDGVSASLTGDKTSWANPAASALNLYSDITILNPNIDTYESINGYSPDIKRNSIGRIGEGWKTGIVTNRRAFVANIKIQNPDSDVKTIYGDRIMYSMPNKFDTFPSFNFIDVVKGDAEAYLKLESFADRLVAFKNNSVQIINVSSPSDTNWFLETDIKNNGVAHPAAVFRSEKGILWANEKGMFLYNGSAIRSLTENKIAQSDWASFITDYSIVGYDGNSNMAMVIRDCENSGATQGDAYIFDFKTKAWSFATDLLDASVGNYTNFITDYNGNLTIGTQNNGDIDLKTFSHTSLTSVPQDTATIRTKDIDFGSPSLMKRIYAVFITYKSDAAQTSPVKLYYDGDSSTGTPHSGNFIDTSGEWKVLRVQHPAAIIGCKSVSVEIQNQTAATGNSSAGLQINDITIEYRLLPKDRLASDT